MSPMAVAQEWPRKQPIRLIVPWPPAGVADFLGRVLGRSLSEQLGQSVIVENKAGAATNIGSEAVARADPDGYTFLLASSNNAVNMSLFKKMPYDTVRDFVPVAMLGYTPMVLVTNPSVPGKDLTAFISYARANPNKVYYASAGNGSPAHLAAEQFMRAAEVQMVHVPYKGASPAVNDLLGGQVQVLITNVPASIAYIKANKLRALAITGETRNASLPEVPTFKEAGLPAYDATAWYGVLAPKGTPAPVVQRLAASINKLLSDPAFQKKLEEQGVKPVANGTPDSFGKVIEDDIARYRKLIADAGIKAE
jgi:tripartite-type tricarboxylate transporter receptor subunit TctC